jgi:diketogulonate reductase-like aldo/keto reductase
MDINTTIQLNSGTSIPQLGFGVWQIREGGEARQAIQWALEAGYRHIDTAQAYYNETSVGEAVRRSGIPRDRLFITTKLWNANVREGTTPQAFDDSLRRLDMEYVDLYLIHWPVDGFERAWLDMETIYRDGRAKAIGLSNFKVRHLERILEIGSVVPAANQMEFNPQMQDDGILSMCREKGIAFEAWSPLGSGKLSADKLRRAGEIGAQYGKSGQQAILRWVLQKGIVVFPKSTHRERILENAALFDFELSEADMRAFDGMNENKRVGPDPDNVNF